MAVAASDLPANARNKVVRGLNVPTGTQFSKYVTSQCAALWSEDGGGDIAIQTKLHEKYGLDPQAFPGWGVKSEQ